MCIRDRPGGERSGVTIRIKPDVFVGHALFGQNFLRLRDRRFVAVQSKRVDPDYRAAFFGKLLVQRFKLGNSRVSTNATVSYTHLDVYKRQILSYAQRGMPIHHLKLKKNWMPVKMSYIIQFLTEITKLY